MRLGRFDHRDIRDAAACQSCRNRQPTGAATDDDHVARFERERVQSGVDRALDGVLDWHQRPLDDLLLHRLDRIVDCLQRRWLDLAPRGRRQHRLVGEGSLGPEEADAHAALPGWWRSALQCQAQGLVRGRA